MSNIKTKLEAIGHLSEAFKHNPQYRKKWLDYIELRVTEVLEDAGIKNAKRVTKIRSEVAERVMRLFDPEWWAALEPPPATQD